MQAEDANHEKTGDVNEQAEDTDMLDKNQIEQRLDNDHLIKEQALSDPSKSDKELVQNLTLLQYYTAGIVFIRQVESAVPHLITLLASNTKGEVVEAMHFFVVSFRFEMECAMVIKFI